MSIRAIIGPKACGKTTNANLLKKHYKAKRIVEEDDLHRTDLKDGDLILTTTQITKKMTVYDKGLPDIKYIFWSQVKRDVSNLIVYP
jgi:ABC-type branched-subunit amino acid transport system ATPase component